MSAGAVPPVLFCTGDGVLARTAAPATIEPSAIHTDPALMCDPVSIPQPDLGNQGFRI